MKNITYESIEALIQEVSVEGSQVHCEFYAGPGQTLSATSMVRRDKSKVSQVGRTVKRQLINRARSQASRSIFRMLGGGVFGRTGAVVVRAAMTNNALTQNEPTESEIQHAVVDAFSRVASNYHYDQDKDEWFFGEDNMVRSENTGDKGEKQVFRPPPVRVATPEPPTQQETSRIEGPVLNRFEKEVFARLLVEVADADGQLDNDESSLLEGLLPEELGSVDKIRNMDPISSTEARALSAETRETIILHAFSLSYSDLQPHENEVGVIQEYAMLMGLSPAKIKELSKLAKIKMLELSLNEDIQRSELLSMARQLNIPEAEAEMVLINYKSKLS